MTIAAALLLTAGGASAAGEDGPRCLTAYFAAAGDRLAYQSCGRGAAVVILPGGPGLDAGYMHDVATTVAAAGFRAILLEPRGTGASREARGDGRHLTVAGSIADIGRCATHSASPAFVCSAIPSAAPWHRPMRSGIPAAFASSS